MHPLIHDLITDFQARKWKSEPIDKALRLAMEAPTEISALAQAVMYRHRQQI